MAKQKLAVWFLISVNVSIALPIWYFRTAKLSRVRHYIFEFRCDWKLWRTPRSFSGAIPPAAQLFRRFATQCGKTRNNYGTRGGPPVLAGPLAFGDAGRRYALATAGILPELEDEGSIEDERGDSIGSGESGVGSPEEHPGEDPLPAEIQRVFHRKAAESARRTTDRATRIRERGKNPPDGNNRQLHRAEEKSRCKQTENYRLRKNEQNARYRERLRANRQQQEAGGPDLPGL